jgi:integrase/recombinase XerD
MNQALLCFERYLKRRFGRSSTAKHYLSDLRIFIRFAGDKPPETVTAADIDGFIDQQIGAGLAATTINRRLSSLHTLFEYLASEQPDRPWPNPVNARRHRLKTGIYLPRDVPDVQVEQLFAIITHPRDRAMFNLMIGAGLRVGEVVSLRIDDIEPPPNPDQLAKIRVRGKGDKERLVWLPGSLWEILQDWLSLRPPAKTPHVFLNHHGRSISVSGIQYVLRQYCQQAQVAISCHRLRHTYARRLAEHGLPIDSLGKLLGHNHLQTTQRYIDGADPTVREDFDTAMLLLDTHFRRTAAKRAPITPSRPSPASQARQARMASPTELEHLLRDTCPISPAWLRASADAFLSYRWPTWRAQTARKIAQVFLSVVRRFGRWLDGYCQVTGWETLRRSDLEGWIQSRREAGASTGAIHSDINHLRMLFKFLEDRDYPVDPALFRIKAPKREKPLPRYLTEAEYRRLEAEIYRATTDNTFSARFDRAWFLTLAHTGMRISELLDLRLSDLNLDARYAVVCGGKPGRDRVTYLTPPLVETLADYLDHRPDLPDIDHVFVLRGRSPSSKTIYKKLKAYGQRVGIQVSPHRLRHTLATRLINRGMPIASLRKLLGHQRLDTTQIYARIHDETLYCQFRDAVSSLEAIAVEEWPQFEEVLLEPQHRSPSKTTR